MSKGIKSLAKNLQGMGRGGDKILAHIMPEEAAMLKRMGGSGTINPHTGLLEFSKQIQGTPLYDPRNKDVHPDLKIRQPIEGTSERMSAMRVDAPVRWASAPNHPSAHLAYITDAEAALLRKADLHGSNIGEEDHVGPAGIPSYQGGGIGEGGGAFGSTTGAGTSGPASDPNGTANTGYSNTGGGGGGGGGGGITSGGGSGIGSIYSGGGGGGSFDLNGPVIGTQPMSIGGTGMGLAGSNASFDTSGVVSYMGGNGNDIGWASQNGFVAPAYTVTPLPQQPQSDMFGVPTLVANAMQSMGTFFGSTVPQMASAAWSAMPSLSIPPSETNTRFNVQPQTVQSEPFGAGIPQSEVDKANAAGFLAGNFSDQNAYALGLTGDAPVPQLSVADASQAETPVIGSTTDKPYISELAESMPSWMSSNEPLFDQAAFDKEMADFRTDVHQQLNGPSSDYLGSESDRAPTYVTASSPFLGSPSPVVMGQGLDLGNQIVGNPLFSDVSVTNPTYSVDVPEMMSLARSYEKSPFGISLASDRTIYDRAIPSLSEYGATFTPDTEGVDMSQDKDFVPQTGIASIPTSSFLNPENKQFFEHFGPSLTQLTPETYQTQWGSSTMGASPYVQSEAQPQTFGSMYGLSVLDTLNADFEQQSQPTARGVADLEEPATRGITIPAQQLPPSTPNPYQQLQPGQVPLYGEAIPYSGPKGALPMTQEQRWTGGGLFSDLEGLYGLPSGYLGKTYGIESGYGENMGSPDRAYGPFQFMPDTARDFGLISDGVDQRADLIQSADAAARLASVNASILRDSLDREPTAGELYLAHQQGATTAVNLLSFPQSPAFDILLQSYSLKYPNDFERAKDAAIKALVGNGGNLTMTAGEFAQQWVQRAEAKPTTLGGQTQYAGLAPTTAAKVRSVSIPQEPPAQYSSLSEVPETEIAQDPNIVSDFLETYFQSNFGGGNGGDNTYQSRSTQTKYPRWAYGDENQTPEPEPTPAPTTGINLSRRVYNPNDFAFVQTSSPAYS